jgi:hypothetical protein
MSNKLFDQRTRQGRIEAVSVYFAYAFLSTAGLVYVSNFVWPTISAWLWVPWIIGSLILGACLIGAYCYVDDAPDGTVKPEPKPTPQTSRYGY